MKYSPNWIPRLRKLLLLAACIPTLVAIFVVEENWRGDHAWAACERELNARGERLDFASFRSPAIPDRINFFKAQLLEQILYKPKDGAYEKGLAATRLLAFDFSRYSGSKDLPALRDRWKHAGILSIPESDSPAADVLTAMKSLEPLLNELHDAALNRPGASLQRGEKPFDLPLLDLGSTFQLGQALAIHASAELAAGHVDAAYADTFALLRLANSLAAHPLTVMELLVPQGMQGAAILPIKEGWQRHAWSEPQLAEFQRLLTGQHPLVQFDEVLRTERAVAVSFLGAEPQAFFRRSLPGWLFHGWIQQNKVALCRYYDDELLPPFASVPDRILAKQAEHLRQTTRRLRTSHSPYQYITRLIAANFAGIGDALGENCDKTLQFATLCALERYRLAHGRAAEKLDELIPDFLPAPPQDVFSGTPLRYEALPGGGHRLLFSGPNGADDRGGDDDIVLELPATS